MSEHKSGWSREFDEPIALPDGGKLVVLRDAANYITALPANDAALPDWQAVPVQTRPATSEPRPNRQNETAPAA